MKKVLLLFTIIMISCYNSDLKTQADVLAVRGNFSKAPGETGQVVVTVRMPVGGIDIGRKIEMSYKQFINYEGCKTMPLTVRGWYREWAVYLNGEKIYEETSRAVCEASPEAA